ncbi:ParB/RepB/Spo0J family partition protein [Streptomyces sp. NBC_00078]|uniref:ParB/RepB/Spo0J family partition protein n=1 Tax=unclassified Streptomyces TaxID=2593676 RepID=UPI00225313DA|nr:ParB/RepB/Spo0J family partition protein [Streptomyces sp. NBC_00078]MCX5418138.1 ParB/RepB/Spo0J family partition protein [Streptomyces sp. NBC_00078]
MTLPLRVLEFADSPRTGGVDTGHVRKLARLDAPLPPVVVHRPTLRVIDGVHRVHAARLRGDDRIDVRYFEGSAEDAFVEAVRLNTTRGLPLTRADRTAAVVRILGAHPQWSDRLVASAAGVTAGTVAAVRKRSTDQSEQLNTRRGMDGRLRPVDPAEGRRRAGLLLAARPGATLRQIATDAGIALATARDVRQRVRRGEDPVPRRFREPGTAAGPASRPGTEPVPGTGDADMGLLVTQLRKDPSLRLTEAGRALLQMLSVPLVLQGDTARQFVEAVPGHRTASVVQVARGCAKRWLEFAEQLEDRS